MYYLRFMVVLSMYYLKMGLKPEVNHNRRLRIEFKRNEFMKKYMENGMVKNG